MEHNLVTEQIVPLARLCGLKFDLLTGADIEKFSSTSVNDASDLTCAKLGLPNASSQCTTCGSTNRQDCDGHFGFLKLPATIYNPRLLRDVVHILNQICPACKSVKKEIRKKLLQRKKRIFNPRKLLLEIKVGKLKLTRSIITLLAKYQKHLKFSGLKERKATVENQEGCKYCARKSGDWYPTIKFKILSKDAQGNKCVAVAAEFTKRLPRRFGNKSLTDVLPKDFWNFLPMVPNQDGKSESVDINRIILSPAQAFHLLREVKQGFIEKFLPRRELIFLSSIPVSPNCQRLMEMSHVHSDGPTITFDKCTKAYRGVFDARRKINEFQKCGFDVASYIASRVDDCQNFSKLHSNKTTAEDRPACTGLKWLKDTVLSKRTDNAFRMTMVGDPKLQMYEIGIPQDVSDFLYIAERVNDHNAEKLRLTCNIHLLSKEGLHVRRNGKLTILRRSNQLKVGDTFHRPLENGDIILINRPPSIHSHSLLALSVKILPIQSVVAINPLCCSPLRGDFDGDCLHGYIPQSVRARVELSDLLGLEHQLFNVQDSNNLLSLTHDSLTAAHLLIEREAILNKFELQQLEMLCLCKSQYPAIIKAPKIQKPQWTGQQLFSMMLPFEMDFVGGSHNNISGVISKLFKYYGKSALNYLFCVQDVLCEYLTMRGFSVSLCDIYLTSDNCNRNKLIDEVSYGLEEAKSSCCFNELMFNPEMGFLLKAHDETDNLSHGLNLSNLIRNRRPITQASVAQFKDLFRELQNVIHCYISKENSLLTMVHAGSKGSLLKLIQQGVCLGMQFSSKPLPFSIPQKLSCSAWNQHKASDSSDGMEEASDSSRGENSYAVIEASFLDGLSPLECFIHALSCRSNMFSDNAEVPGTLTRKIMFYMRDVYLAYDGTVRNAYGQQLVQFSYGSQRGSSSKGCKYSQEFVFEEDSELNGLGGQPVGSLAACSISEAAYGALDQPVNSLEPSPLLNLKKVLECAPAKASVDQTATLVLSTKLKKLNYGFEYGALAVKNHLDRVFFSDVVTSVRIIYDSHYARGARGIKVSPWISLFHMNKERMMRKRTTVQSILNALNRESALLNPVLPRLFLTSKDCGLDEQKELEEYGISVAVEDSHSSEVLDIIRDSVIPALLNTHIKGFMEFKQVDILWDSQSEPDGQLILKIAMSEECSRGKFWHTLLDACIPIMDLIDWERSHPDGVYGISDAFGISTAWNYFLGSLKSAVCDVGRNVNLEHLLLVSDSLSVTGEFHGLSTKGLKKQRANLSISSPFTQACFSNPEKCFFDAAKQGSVDHLYGAVDVLAWGAEVAVGTGGPFKLIYSGEVHNQMESENIYETLLSLKPDKSNKPPGLFNCEKWKGQPFVAITGGNERRWDDSKCSTDKKSNAGINSKFLSMSIGSWANIMDMMSSLREILHNYPFNDHLNEEHKSLLMEALMYHPKKDAKIGTGIKEIKIGQSQGSRCFILIRKDGTTDDFSYRKCVVGAATQISPDFGLMVEKKVYHR